MCSSPVTQAEPLGEPIANLLEFLLMASSVTLIIRVCMKLTNIEYCLKKKTFMWSLTSSRNWFQLPDDMYTSFGSLENISLDLTNPLIWRCVPICFRLVLWTNNS